MNTYYIRASSFSTLTDCPARWHAQHILGLRFPSSAAAHLGTSIHASTAAFDQAHIDGLDITASDAAGVFVDTLRNGTDVDWSDADLTKKEAEAVGLTLHTKYCAEISPTQDFIAVEEGMPDLTVDFADLDVRIVLTGHIDRIRRTDAGLGVADLKSGKNSVGKDGSVVTSPHLIQLGVYELLTEAALDTVLTAPAAIYGLGTGATRQVGIGECNESPKHLLLGNDDQMGLLEMAARMFKNDLFWGNPKSQLCSGKYCPAFNSCRWKGTA